MITNGIQWWGQYNPSLMKYTLQAIKHTTSGERFAIFMECKTEPLEGATTHSPTLALEPEEAQSLFNALWGAGLRPRDGQGGLAHTDAQAAHIADLRAIALHKCGVKQ